MYFVVFTSKALFSDTDSSELSWCNLKGENDSQHFYSPIKYSQLNWKDRRTVNHVYRHVHGLRFEASYKILEKMGIPSVDLGEYGCPKADQLFSSHFPAGSSCGNHRQTLQWIHCPKQETFLFYQWLKQQTK